VVNLNLDDPFEASIAVMVELNRKKRADYALDSDPWSNFRQTATRAGMDSPLDAVVFNIEQKLVRLQALKANGRQPRNESVNDTWLDIAVYSAIGLTIADELSEEPKPVRSKRPVIDPLSGVRAMLPFNAS
jgi:hypothetical protein